MIKIEDKIISLDIFKKHFLCDLNSCQGQCCVEGESGAPLLNEEKIILDRIYKKIKPNLTKEALIEIKKNGIAVIDKDKELTTSLVNNRECVFAIKEDGITKCSIEKTYLSGKINFRKPISCHLFPIRVKEYTDFDALNYEKIKICDSACTLGKKKNVRLYQFLKDPLIRKYGKSWYKKLLKVADLIEKKGS